MREYLEDYFRNYTHAHACTHMHTHRHTETDTHTHTKCRKSLIQLNKKLNRWGKRVASLKTWWKWREAREETEVGEVTKQVFYDCFISCARAFSLLACQGRKLVYLVLLELQSVGSCHVGAENWISPLAPPPHTPTEDQQVLLNSEHFFSPEWAKILGTRK